MAPSHPPNNNGWSISRLLMWAPTGETHQQPLLGAANVVMTHNSGLAPNPRSPLLQLFKALHAQHTVATRDQHHRALVRETNYAKALLSQVNPAQAPSF